MRYGLRGTGCEVRSENMKTKVSLTASFSLWGAESANNTQPFQGLIRRRDV